jgi:cell division protein FtsW
MKQLLQNLRGDKGIWSFVALLALFSFMPVFSASSNLAYMGKGTGNTLSYLLKHLLHTLIGFLIIYKIHKISYQHYKGVSRIVLPIVWILLAYTLFFGVEKGSASRWIQIPFIGISFQTSTFAFVVLMIFVARYLSRMNPQELTFKSSAIDLWLPVGITIMLILPSNFSTAAFIFSMVLMLVFIGRYPLRYIGIVLVSGLTLLTLFIATAKIANKTNPDNNIRLFQRVATWEGRADRFFDKENNQDPDEIYQIERAKTAIATGGVYGLGPGKSVQKNFLPQSSSDFIYAIIVEEFGLLGGLSIVLIYILLFIRFLISAQKANTLFGKLLIVGLGFPIIFQAIINMGVAVELLPTTGQTLPLISSGGSSIWMTCIAIGIILNVTKKDEEIAEENAEKAKREDALQRMIDNQIKEEAAQAEKENNEDNPMNAVLNKA